MVIFFQAKHSPRASTYNKYFQLPTVAKKLKYRLLYASVIPSRDPFLFNERTATMVRLCKGQGCCFGLHGTAKCSAGKSLCGLCSLPADLSDKERAGLVRTLNRLTESGNAAILEAAYLRLATVPGLEEHVRGAVAQKSALVYNTQKDTSEKMCGAKRQLEEPPSKPLSDSAPAQIGVHLDPEPLPGLIHLDREVLDQGAFGWCSFYALATSVSGALFAKYNVHVEPQALFDQWLGSSVFEKSMWPDDAAVRIGCFRIKKATAVHEVRAHVTVIDSFKAAAEYIWWSGGVRRVIVVAEVKGHNHTMVGLRWCSNGDLLCLNSWGGDAHPSVLVRETTFVRGYLVDVEILRTWTPLGGHGSRTVEVAPPPVSMGWD